MIYKKRNVFWRWSKISSKLNLLGPLFCTVIAFRQQQTISKNEISRNQFYWNRNILWVAWQLFEPRNRRQRQNIASGKNVAMNFNILSGINWATDLNISSDENGAFDLNNSSDENASVNLNNVPEKSTFYPAKTNVVVYCKVSAGKNHKNYVKSPPMNPTNVSRKSRFRPAKNERGRKLQAFCR